MMECDKRKLKNATLCIGFRLEEVSHRFTGSHATHYIDDSRVEVEQFGFLIFVGGF